jgi:hypothetical protein
VRGRRALPARFGLDKPESIIISGYQTYNALRNDKVGNTLRNTATGQPLANYFQELQVVKLECNTG